MSHKMFPQLRASRQLLWHLVRVGVSFIEKLTSHFNKTLKNSFHSSSPPFTERLTNLMHFSFYRIIYIKREHNPNRVFFYKVIFKHKRKSLSPLMPRDFEDQFVFGSFRIPLHLFEAVAAGKSQFSHMKPSPHRYKIDVIRPRKPWYLSVFHLQVENQRSNDWLAVDYVCLPPTCHWSDQWAPPTLTDRLGEAAIDTVVSHNWLSLYLARSRPGEAEAVQPN